MLPYGPALVIVHRVVVEKEHRIRTLLLFASPSHVSFVHHENSLANQCWFSAKRRLQDDA
jgi:hypothetical protein